MGMPRLTTCCFIFDLKTGNTIMGVMNSVLSFIMLMTLIVTASIFGTLMDDKDIEDDADARATMTGLYVMTIILVLMYLVKFFSDLVFVYAIRTDNARLIRGYLVIWLAFFLLSTFIFFLHVTDFHGTTIVSELLYIGENIYVLLLAYSFYDQINTREEI